MKRQLKKVTSVCLGAILAASLTGLRRKFRAAGTCSECAGTE